MNGLRRAWRRYRYRFVPWLLLNIKNRSLRIVTEHDGQGRLSEADFEASLFQFFTALNKSEGYDSSIRGKHGTQIMQQSLGFSIQRTRSVLEDGGLGVKVTSGMIPAGSITSLYPGLVYEPHDPVFFQSIGNPFVFKCADGILVDGNDKGLSRRLFRSCRKRDSCWPLPSCDESWLTPNPINPLNVGQYVNNQTKSHPANVTYEEFEVPDRFPARLRQFLPNIFFSSGYQAGIDRNLKVVALVSLRDIHCGEELFSSYFTIVK